MASLACFIGRKEHRHEGRGHYAEVSIRAEPCPDESQILLSEAVLSTLREVFGSDFEHQRHCVRSGVAVQIDLVNVSGEMPHAGNARFRAEVVEVRVSGDAGREISGCLLTVAGMDAIAAYLVAWENQQRALTG